SARRTAGWGAAAGAAGGAWALLAMAPDIFNLVREQSRLVLSIAAIYGQSPRVEERLQEIAAVFAIASGATAAGRLGSAVVRRSAEHEAVKAIASKLGSRMFAERLGTLVPVAGGALGASINYFAVRSIGRAAVRYYAAIREQHVPEKLPAPQPVVPSE
ncbi:MAG: EcsC family protein, partial [Thermoanaerobaculia bacterium]